MDAATGAAVWINSNNDGLGTMSAQNAVAVTITGGTITNITDLTVADGGTGSSTAADARANLGLAIGTDVQAYDADTAKLDVIQTFTAAQTLDSLILGGTVSGADHILNRVILLDYGETVNIMGALGGGAVNIDLELGNVVSATVDTSATTITFTNPTSTAIACGITLWLTNGGSQTFSVTNAINKGGVAPTLTAAGLDKLVYETIDNGTTWSQDLAGAAYA
jgi:hypothetical protein